MNLKKDYEKLYQHWLDEFNKVELTPFTQELYNYYGACVDSLKKEDKFSGNDIKNDLLKSYQENLNFLFEDFLKLREIKIINAALAFKEINLKDVSEAEKLFYQNLISAVKGFKKIKALSANDNKTHNEPEIKDIKLEKNEPIVKERPLDEKKLHNFTLIRFLRNTPSLVGVDLINYGPFEKEDIANLPLKNSEILINEKNAEKIELNDLT